MVEISRDEELNGIYDREEHERRVRNSLIEDALEDGWNRGKKEANLEIAKRMLDKNIDEDTILEIACITLSELKKLKENM